MADDRVIIGGEQLFNFLQTLSVKVERNIMRSALRSGAAVIREKARENVPVRLGALRKSIRVTTGSKKGIVTASVKAGSKEAYYWRWVEYGTKGHLIKVEDNERAINYRLTAKRGKLTYVSMSTVNRNVLRIGNTFVGPTVSHPGAKESPYMRPALDSEGDNAIAAIVAQIKKRLTAEGINMADPGGDNEN
jgi:HK97 gp10 family phage protein